jgi:hypothetical protein
LAIDSILRAMREAESEMINLEIDMGEELASSDSWIGGGWRRSGYLGLDLVQPRIDVPQLLGLQPCQLHLELALAFHRRHP